MSESLQLHSKEETFTHLMVAADSLTDVEYSLNTMSLQKYLNLNLFYSVAMFTKSWFLYKTTIGESVQNHFIANILQIAPTNHIVRSSQLNQSLLQLSLTLIPLMMPKL